MSFSLETTDMDLGDTAIENIFINDYMPMANGTYVKVYLLGFKYASDRDSDMEVDNQVIANHLQIPLEDVFNAWDFWEEKGIIEKIDQEDRHNYKVKFLSLKQLYIKNNYNILQAEGSGQVEKREVTVQDVLEANEIPRLNEMFNNIDHIMRRQIQTPEKRKVINWIEDYNMDPDVIEMAFKYTVEQKGIRRGAFQYIDAIIRNWYDDGLTSLEAVMRDLKEKDERYYQYNKILKSLGISNRNPTDGEKKRIDKWFDDFNYDLDLILRACENSSKTSNPNINYIDAIISSWNEKGIKSIDDIESLDRRPEEDKIAKSSYVSRKPKSVKTRFHNFEQRSDKYSAEDLEEVARRKRREYMEKIKGEA